MRKKTLNLILQKYKDPPRDLCEQLYTNKLDNIEKQIHS